MYVHGEGGRSEIVTASRLHKRGLSFLLLTLWAWLMIGIGLMAILDFPSRFRAPKGFFVLVGIVLVAMGLFIAGVTADRLFAGANSRLTGAFELLTWITIVLVVIAAVAGAMM